MKLIVANSKLPGDRVDLPVDLLEDLVDKQYPLTFKIVFNGKSIACGVREFTAQANHVYIGDYIQSFLNVKSGDEVDLVPFTLAKGSFMKIQPKVHDSYHQIKYVLESHLRLNHTTLTANALLQTDSNSFVISQLQPDEMVSCIDTDIEIIIDMPQSSDSSWINYSFSANIDLGNSSKYYKVMLLDPVKINHRFYFLSVSS
jgi:hypothetical protein